MDIRRRLADVVLATGAVCVVVSTPLLWRYREPAGELSWLMAMAVLVAAAAYTWHRLPDNRAAWWFALAAASAAMQSRPRVGRGVDARVHHPASRGSRALRTAWATS